MGLRWELTRGRIHALPRVLIGSDGRHAVHAPPSLDAGVLVRDTDLAALVHRSSSDCPPDAVDIDSVAGLGSDDAAVDFVTGRLGIEIILTRRPQLARRAAERGHLGLVHVFAYDSTGMARSLEGHPDLSGVGSSCRRVSSLSTSGLTSSATSRDRSLAYGLIASVDEALACGALADSIVVRPPLAAKLAARELVAS